MHECEVYFYPWFSFNSYQGRLTTQDEDPSSFGKIVPVSIRMPSRACSNTDSGPFLLTPPLLSHSVGLGVGRQAKLTPLVQG